jgi:hypothetical protein
MNSARFEFRIPFQSKAYTWLKNLQDSKKNVSRALRLLIETHSELFDKLTIEQNRVQALKRQIAVLEHSGSPDFRAALDAKTDYASFVRKIEAGENPYSDS